MAELVYYSISLVEPVIDVNGMISARFVVAKVLHAVDVSVFG